MRTVLVYIAIAALLLCPYHCAVKRAAAQTLRSEVTQACCAECLARQNSIPRAPVDPQSPGPDEGSRSCFCEGAAFDAQARVEISHPQSVHWTWVIDPCASLGSSLMLAHGDREIRPPPDEGGLATRITICSLLL
jgi:hypothetical protein